MIGRSNARRGARRMFAVLQNRRLNQHLVYTVFDEVRCYLEFFPALCSFSTRSLQHSFLRLFLVRLDASVKSLLPLPRSFIPNVSCFCIDHMIIPNLSFASSRHLCPTAIFIAVLEIRLIIN
jgi:hypothetical protein